MNPSMRSALWTLCWLALTSSGSYGVSPQFWNTTSFQDFSKGTLKGLSIGRDGKISLAPKFDSVFDSDQALIWSAVIDSKKNLYVGTGHDGKVFKIDAKGTSNLFFDASELDVLALTLDAESNLYAASSPDGRVYKVDAAGKGSVFFDPEDKYIWDMTFDSKGNLFVATGNKGKIYKVGKDGKGDLFFDSGQSNVICLATDNDDNVIAGSDQNGYVFRLSPEGKASVLYDSGMREVHDVHLDSRGYIYLVAVNAGGSSSIPETKTIVPEVTGTENVSVSLSLPATLEKKSTEELPSFKGSLGRSSRREVGSVKSSIFRISRNGMVEPLWSSEGESIYALMPQDDDSLLFSTGTKGRIYSLDRNKKQTLLVETTEEQTTRMIPSGNELLVCTSNLAKIYRLSADLNKEGSYESEVKDTQSNSTWGNIQWKGEVPPGTSIKVYTRSGNTKKADKTWSEWSKGYSKSEGELITNARARYIQYKVVLNSSSQTTPSLEQIVIPYLQQNYAPEVKSITVLPPGVAYQRPPGVPTSRAQSVVTDQSSAEASGASDAIPPQSTVSIPPRRVFQKGAQSFTWESEDRNGDDLFYTVFLRAEKETGWRLLRKEVEERFLTLETETVPDGKYQLRVTASDAPSNPKANALTGEQISAVFEVDNSPPRVEVVSQDVQKMTSVVKLKATDVTSVLRKAEISIDGNDWETVISVDGIVDSRFEEFEIHTDHTEAGEHTVAVRVYDSSGNVGIGKALLYVK